VWDHQQIAEEYESSMSELLTAIKWDQGSRGVGQWNDPMEFLECLLENMQENLEVHFNVFLNKSANDVLAKNHLLKLFFLL